MIITVVGCETSQPCLSYHSGTFITHSPVTGNKISVVRSDSIQTEIDAVTGSAQKSKIVWKTPCEYHIVGFYTNNTKPDSIDSFFMTAPIKVKIISAHDNYYIFKARVDSATKYKELIDTMWKEK